MIFVTLGTQDKQFKRLLDLIENSHIDDEIIVQAGFTKYSSNKMKIYDYLEKSLFEKYIYDADLIISHAGVGTLVSSLKRGKKVLAVPRLAKYGEHHNDHQLQIADAYYQKGYIEVLKENEDIDKKLKEMKDFKPKKFVANNEIFVNKLKDYIML